jgi:outer membrane protein TolC
MTQSSICLEVLDTETWLFAELSRVLAAAGERVAVVQLYKALGGGWQIRSPDDAPVPAALKTP